MYIKEVKVSQDLIYPLVIMDDAKLKEKANKLNNLILKTYLGINVTLNSIKDALLKEQSDAKTEPYSYLEFLSYNVIFNNNELFTFDINSFWYVKGTENETKQYNINVSTGELILMQQAFTENLHNLIDKKVKIEFQKRITQSITKLKNKGNWNEMYKEDLQNYKIETMLLDFRITENGVNFIYDNQLFSHGDMDCRPNELYFFSWQEIKSVIKKDSPINSVIN
ncbi:hypothetical protein OF897_10670 [Chryseobacterium formosus]|uniref:DUF3298 domain-containing protein n=2 Tax=Chryseobacterium formosus TaxID=1537363 RepID=A0ABT3XS53_9FLAO|nr:hypothetical protein [Chryseobacterium formosus]